MHGHLRNRYLLFGTNRYGNTGGWGDFLAAFSEIGDAKEYIASKKKSDGCPEYLEVIDVELLLVVMYVVVPRPKDHSEWRKARFRKVRRSGKEALVSLQDRMKVLEESLKKQT